MPTIKVEYILEVNASAEKLWNILADVKSWPEWQGTSYLHPVSPGSIREGSTFRVELGGFRWNLTVNKAEKPHKICWTGKGMGLVGVHEWEFTEEAGKTRVVTRESMSGWTLIPSYPLVKSKLPATDKKWLADLKSRAERP